MRAVVLPDGEHQVVMENVPEYSIEVRNLQNRSEKEKSVSWRMCETKKVNSSLIRINGLFLMFRLLF